MTEEDTQASSKIDSGNVTFAIQKLYVKDMSFETPNSPAVFDSEWEPDTDLQLHTTAQEIRPDVYEVAICVTATVTMGDKTAYLVELQQAGIFSIGGLDEHGLGIVLGSTCPGILFPYAREAISDLVIRGGFPQFLLAPVNFDVLYAKHLDEQEQNKSSGEEQNEGRVEAKE